MNTLL